MFLFPSDTVPEMEMLDNTTALFPLFKEAPHCFPEQPYQFATLPTVPRVPFSPHPCQHLSLVFLMTAILTGMG